MGDADAGQRLDHRAHGGGIAVLVIMGASGEHQHRLAGEGAGNDLARMAGDTALRKARQVGVGDAHRILDFVDEPAETRTQNEGGRGRQSAQPFDKPVNRCLHFSISPWNP